MTSLLFSPPLKTLAPHEALIAKEAELEAHSASMDMHLQLRDNLPRSLKNFSYPIAIIGLMTAAARLYASAPDQATAMRSIAEMPEALMKEYAYWNSQVKIMH